MPTTTGMKSGGYYDAHSTYQEKVVESGCRFVEQAVATMTLPAPERMFTVVDYGCSQGRNSTRVVSHALDAVRARQPGRLVSVVHNDLPTNDFNTLFRNLSGPEAPGYARAEPTRRSTYVFASGVSFYEPLMPPESVQLGMSFSAAHWLRELPTVRKDAGIYLSQLPASVRAQLATQAHDDWTELLTQRARELGPGGRLLVQMVGRTEAAAPAAEEVTAQRLLDLMDEVCRDLVHDGRLRSEAYERFIFPVYPRSVTEAVAPITAGAAPLRAALVIEHAGVHAIPCPYYARYRETRDATEYATAP